MYKLKSIGKLPLKTLCLGYTSQFSIEYRSGKSYNFVDELGVWLAHDPTRVEENYQPVDPNAPRKPNTILYVYNGSNYRWFADNYVTYDKAFGKAHNLKLTLESVKLANKVGCRRWTGLGSHAEYGNPNRKTNELDETKPTTLYGKLKLKSCRQSLSLCKQLGMRGSWIRIYDTYGPNDNDYLLISRLAMIELPCPIIGEDGNVIDGGEGQYFNYPTSCWEPFFAIWIWIYDWWLFRRKVHTSF